MDLDTAKKAISRYLNADDEFDNVLIDLFGGEPLLAYPLIKEIITWTQTQEWKKKYKFAIGTNGTLLNTENKKWFSRNKKHILLGMSIDGNRETHNLNRSNSYDLIFPHIDFLKENWPDQPIKMTISAETILYVADSVIELERMGLFFTCNLPFENIWGSPENKLRLLSIYKEQLDRLANFYVENSHLYPVSPMLGILPEYLGLHGLNISGVKDCVRYCGAGHEMVIIDVDGKEYPCHRFLPWVAGKEAPTFPINRQTSWEPEMCKNCKIVQSCPTCAGYNWEVNNDSGIRTTYHCDAHKLEVLAAAKIYAFRLKNIPLSRLETLSRDEQFILNEKLRPILELMQNDI